MRLRCRAKVMVRAAVMGGACLVSLTGAAQADPLRDEIEQMRATLRDEIAALKLREQQLDQQVLRLDGRN